MNCLIEESLNFSKFYSKNDQVPSTNSLRNSANISKRIFIINVQMLAFRYMDKRWFCLNKTTDLYWQSGTAQEPGALRRQWRHDQENGEVTESHHFQRLVGHQVHRYNVNETAQYLWRINTMKKLRVWSCLK